MRFQTTLSLQLLLCVAIAFQHIFTLTDALSLSPSSFISVRSTSTRVPHRHYSTLRSSTRIPVLKSYAQEHEHNVENEKTNEKSIRSQEKDKETKFNLSNISRRTLFSQSALTFFLASASYAPPIFAAETTESTSLTSSGKTILITGSNSGIGFNAAYRMALSSSPSEKHTIILACRTLEKAQNAALRIQNLIGDSNQNDSYTLIPKECNLADLSSIQNFVSDLKKDVKQLDVVCLNAGLALNTADKEAQRTKDGFELTIGTNHLGHFYLNSLLLPLVNPTSGRIVVTASGVHDPESPGGKQGNKATLGSMKGFQDAVTQSTTKFDMVGGDAYDPDKAYKDSKLCNVLFTRELQKRLVASNSNIKAYCFNPGLIVGTGFFRYQNPLFTKVFDLAATDLFKVGETPSWGGGTLAYMALNPDVGRVGDTIQGGLYYDAPPGSSKYGDQAYGTKFSIAGISKEASDDAKAAELWSLSEKLVGISS